MLSTLGVPFSRQIITIYSAGIANIINAMNRQGDGLFDTDRISDYRLQEDHADGIFTSRADLAACLITQASRRWNQRRASS